MVAFLSGAVLTAANLNSAFNALTFRAVTGTSDTFVLADNGGAVSYSNASPITATVPPFSSVAYANGTKIELLNLGAGVVTVTAGVGVTLNGSSVALAQNTGGTLIKTATNTWYFLPSASAGAGMDLITPTSVAGSGVTLSGGAVSFSAASTVSVNGCFTAAYDNYLIAINSTASSTSDTTRLRLRAAGTDVATGYPHTLIDGAFNANSVSGAGSSLGTTGWLLGYSQSGLGTTSNVSLFSPFLSTRTAMAATEINMAAAGNAGVAGGYQSSASSYDGFSYAILSGNITGTLRIYGLRNS